MPSVPALALGVVAAPAPVEAGRSGRSSSSSGRPSSRRSGDSKNGNRKNGDNRIDSDRNESSTKNNTDDDPNKTTIGSVNQKSGVGENADAGRGQQPGVLVGTATNNDRGTVAGSGTGGRGSGGGGSGGQPAAGTTVPVPVKRRISVQVAAAQIVDKVCFLMLLSLRDGPCMACPARVLSRGLLRFCHDKHEV